MVSHSEGLSRVRVGSTGWLVVTHRGQRHPQKLRGPPCKDGLLPLYEEGVGRPGERLSANSSVKELLHASYLQLVVTKNTDDSGHTDPAHEIFSLKEPNEAGEHHFHHSTHQHPPVALPDPLPTWMLGFWALRSTLASPGKFCRSSMKGRLSSWPAALGWGSAGLLAAC